MTACLPTRDSRRGRANRSLRAASLALASVVLLVSCGKKGPPLAPFVRVPAAVATVTPQRFGNDVYVTFAVPSTNADGQKPADIGAVEVYAVTADRPPATEKQRELATLIATLPVRPILPDLPVPADGTPPPPIPLPPGVDQAATVAVRETLTPEVRVPIELPIERDRSAPAPETASSADEFFGPLIAPPPSALPHRHYFVVAISPRGRDSLPSAPVSAPLEAGSSAPGAPVISNTATEMNITWPPSPDARSATILAPPTVKPVVGANATPGNVTPRVPAPLAPLAAKSLGFNTQATTYNIYEVSQAATAAEDPFAIKLPPPLTPAPIADTQYSIKGVSFGIERCFEVRPVDQIFGAPVIGPASPRTCFTAKDSFPPAAPKSLAAIAGAGVINLIWDANSEADLAGYIVLRGEAPGDTLQPITKEPVAVTSYRDETVRAGTRYVYAIVAVDRAVPPNASPQSNRVEETARQ